METTKPPSTAPATTSHPVTPFPTASAHAGEGSSAAALESPGTGSASGQNMTSSVDRFVKQAASAAHATVDNVAGGISSIAGGLKDGSAEVAGAQQEWLEAARDAIREHPFATVAGALVVGAALLSLVSMRRD